MTIGTSLVLIAAGAILRYAVTATVSGVSLTTIGLILMIIGIVGFVLSLLYTFALGPAADRPARTRPLRTTPVAVVSSAGAGAPSSGRALWHRCDPVWDGGRRKTPRG